MLVVVCKHTTYKIHYMEKDQEAATFWQPWPFFTKRSRIDDVKLTTIKKGVN